MYLTLRTDKPPYVDNVLYSDVQMLPPTGYVRVKKTTADGNPSGPWALIHVDELTVYVPDWPVSGGDVWVYIGTVHANAEPDLNYTLDDGLIPLGIYAAAEYGENGSTSYSLYPMKSQDMFYPVGNYTSADTYNECRFFYIRCATSALPAALPCIPQ